MNQALMRARTGMGFGPDLLPSPDDPAYWNDPYQDYPRRPTYTTQPTFPSSSPGVIAPQIPTLVALGLRTISNIFAPPATSIAQAQAARPQVIYAGSGRTDQYGNVIPTTGGGIGFGVDSQGIRLSDGSHIGWFPIIGVIGVFFLLQSPGFSRRSR
jgi:hypothetical protein